MSLGRNSHQISSPPRAISSYRNKNWYLLEISHSVPQSSESPMDTENCCCTTMKLAFWEVEWLAQGHTINMKVMEVGGATLSVWLQSIWVNRKLWVSSRAKRILCRRETCLLKDSVGVCQWYFHRAVKTLLQKVVREVTYRYVRAVECCAQISFLLCPSSGQPHGKCIRGGLRGGWGRKRATGSV